MNPSYTPTLDDVIVVAVDAPAGSALAGVLLARGHRVAVVGTRASMVVPLVAGREDHAMAIVADVGDPAQVTAVLDRVQRRLGTPTVLTDPDRAFGPAPWQLTTITAPEAETRAA